MSELLTIVRVPANIMLGVELLDIEPGFQSIARAVSGRTIESLQVQPGGLLSRCAWADKIDGWGDDEGRFGITVAGNLRASLLLGWPITAQEMLVGDIIFTSYTDEGETTSVPSEMYEWLLTYNFTPIPGI